jgi:hypothetical protein
LAKLAEVNYVCGKRWDIQIILKSLVARKPKDINEIGEIGFG